MVIIVLGYAAQIKDQKEVYDYSSCIHNSIDIWVHFILMNLDNIYCYEFSSSGTPCWTFFDENITSSHLKMSRFLTCTGDAEFSTE